MPEDSKIRDRHLSTGGSYSLRRTHGHGVLLDQMRRRHHAKIMFVATLSLDQNHYNTWHLTNRVVALFKYSWVVAQEKWVRCSFTLQQSVRHGIFLFLIA